MKATKKEIRQALSDRQYWREITKIFPGWRLYGWTYRAGATFFTPQHLRLTGAQRDAIVAAFKEIGPRRKVKRG